MTIMGTAIAPSNTFKPCVMDLLCMITLTFETVMNLVHPGRVSNAMCVTNQVYNNTEFKYRLPNMEKTLPCN